LAARARTKAEGAGLMEAVVERGNLWLAYQRVVQNKGAAGVDDLAVSELKDHLKRHWPAIRAKLLSGEYIPAPVRRVDIPKPQGGVRTLGIPTVVDRLIQQALNQVLQPIFEPHFSQGSFGFRPGRNAHQGLQAARQHVAAGKPWVVDIDLEKFFDRVNHDLLMGKLAQKIGDPRVLKLIRRYLEAGLMAGGLVSPRREGTPQGGPLSPLLSNLMLDVMDKELERRGHNFVRYADDCNIYVRSHRGGERVMASIERFLAKHLKLKVNKAKSAVAQPGKRKFLGFGFTNGKQPRRRIAPQSRARFRSRVRELTRRTRGKSLAQIIKELSVYLIGWRGYFGFCETPSMLRELDQWTRRRLRAVVWMQWKRGTTRYAELRRCGVGRDQAAQAAGSPRGPWRLSNSPALAMALSNASLKSLGLVTVAVPSQLNLSNRRIRTRMYGGVGGEES
jgi:RNA-directed DNA polymerase